MNIYDIAREAGVSIATVSRVLNHKDIVRADTRAKVEKVLKRCNYAPSAIAQGMVSKSLHTVAVLTVDIRDSHYARTAYTIEREFGRRGYEVILCNTGGDRVETLRTLQAVAQKQVDGLILVGSIFNTICQGAEMENLLRKMPVVLANGTLALPDAYSVMVDDCRGVEMAVEHLVKTGEEIEKTYGIPIINKRISVTPIAMLLGACPDADPVDFAKALDAAGKPYIKLVASNGLDERKIANKVQKRAHGLRLARRAVHVAVGDAGELHDLRRDGHAGIDERLKALRHDAIFHAHRADLGDAVNVAVQAGRFDINRGKCCIGYHQRFSSSFIYCVPDGLYRHHPAGFP